MSDTPTHPQLRVGYPAALLCACPVACNGEDVIYLKLGTVVTIIRDGAYPLFSCEIANSGLVVNSTIRADQLQPM